MHVGFASVQMSSGYLLFKAPNSPIYVASCVTKKGNTANLHSINPKKYLILNTIKIGRKKPVNSTIIISITLGVNGRK